MEVRKIEKDGIRLVIVRDECPNNPREWDNLGIMVCFHRSYDLGDKHDFSTPQDFESRITAEKNHILTLYLYDHGGSLTMNTEGFYYPWDSGQVGWIYVSKKDAEWQGVANPLECLENEVEVYNQYLTGEVYGFYIEQDETCETCKHTKANHLDSCYGFYGRIQDSGMRESIEEKYQGLFDELLTQI